MTTTDKASSRDQSGAASGEVPSHIDLGPAKYDLGRKLNVIVRTAKSWEDVAERAAALFASPGNAAAARPQILERYISCHGADLADRREAERYLVYILDGPSHEGSRPDPNGEQARKALLTMEITGGKLVMSIGVEALATAIEGGPMFEEGTVVTDHDVFAAEVLTQLQDEDEAGTNLIHRAFDSAFEAVAESGAEGVTFPEGSF